MISSLRLVGALALTTLLVGCGVDLGAGAGVEARSAHAVGFGRIAAATKLGTPLNDHGFLVGASLESRAEQSVGSRYDTGLMFGWGSGPSALGGRWGFEAYGEAGTPVRGAFFRNGDFFAGAGVAAPFHFSKPRHVVDMNEATWIAIRRLELVPMLRTRFHFDHSPGQDVDWKADVTGGIALRLRVMSDLL